MRNEIWEIYQTGYSYGEMNKTNFKTSD